MSVTTATTPSSTHFTPQDPRKLRHLYGAMAGSTFEVFDWAIYSTFAAFFATSFFAKDGVSAFLGANLVFAVGFIARPVGSLIFGHISDTRGRKVSLFGTSAAALLGTAMIALAPTQHTIGIGAAIVLVTARIIQGLAHGGEQPAAGAYVSEMAKPHNRGLWSSWVYVAILAGGLLGNLLGAVLTSVLGADALITGGWRIAFGVGALGSIYALVLVSRLPETEVFKEAQDHAQRPSIAREMLRAWRPALMIIGLTLGVTIAFQNWAAMTGYHIAVFHADPSSTLWASVGSNLIAMASLPLWGALSDRIGRKPVVLIGLAGVAVTTFGLMQFLDGSAGRMFVAQALSMVLLAAPLSILPALMAELVPTSIRTIGVGFSYAVATAVFGGTVSALQTWIGANWGPQYFGVYVAIAVLISIIVALVIPETRGKDLKENTSTRSHFEEAQA
ncbi:MFS transporter [uncultured Tessaracoccus sp.]|uniref:MFS transporter n=1 Tax=uncultured Tessaracoccus sp. TaxID=905023 RepID=UPI00262462C2|nr:MFS transporter [uncultured Tessaracoccus sp.]